MFVPFWLIFLVSGLVMAVFSVAWGIRSRQFDDQERARFLPLAGLEATESKPKAAAGAHRAEHVAIYVMLLIGMMTIGAGLFFTLRHM
jgi:nitrogen fixation-related uncharacterized protein